MDNGGVDNGGVDNGGVRAKTGYKDISLRHDISHSEKGGKGIYIKIVLGEKIGQDDRSPEIVLPGAERFMALCES